MPPRDPGEEMLADATPVNVTPAAQFVDAGPVEPGDVAVNEGAAVADEPTQSANAALFEQVSDPVDDETEGELNSAPEEN